MKNKKGITLISLVVTIIILLILAGVTLNMILSNNGIFDMTKKATESYQIASEREYLEQNVLLVQLDKHMGNVSSEKLGDELKERNVENSYNWHIVKIKDSGKQYDTGWNYVEKGTELGGYGKAKNNWLVNYETGEIIQLEENNYSSILAGDMLAVKDNLIINIDSSIIDDENGNKTKEDIEKQLGKGVELHNFAEEGTSESGLTSTSFNFDGVDDYITIQYDKPEQKDALAKQGFTFEFYGIWNPGKNYWIDNNEEFTGTNNGLFYYGPKNKIDFSWFRFGISHSTQMTNLCLMWSASGGVTACHDKSDYCLKNYEWEIDYLMDNNEFKPNEPYYLTVTLDTKNVETKNEKQGIYADGTSFMENGQFYKQKCYINGKKIYDSDFNKTQWDIFINDLLNSFDCFTIGRINCEVNRYAWNYSKLNCYALRLYSRGLTEEEVNKNYEKSVEYHSLLE